MKKKEIEDKPLKFLLTELKPIYPEIEPSWSRSQLYGLLLRRADAAGRLSLSAEFMNWSDTAYLMQETLEANKRLCSWTLSLTIVTGFMALATVWMAQSTYQMANVTPSQPNIGYKFDLVDGKGYPILLHRPIIYPKEIQ